MTQLSMMEDTKRKRRALKRGNVYRVEIPYPRVRNFCSAGKANKTMTLIDFRDGGVVVMQESCLVPANCKGTDPDYSFKLANGQVRWKTGTRLRSVKRSWIKDELNGLLP